MQKTYFLISEDVIVITYSAVRINVLAIVVVVVVVRNESSAFSLISMSSHQLLKETC